MSRALRWLMFLGRPYRALASAYDERNIRRLERHLASSEADARDLYRLARRDGYGGAVEAVLGFGSGASEPPPAGA